MSELCWKDIDRRIWNDELAAFVPQEIFDVHTHIYDCRTESNQNSNHSTSQDGELPQWPLSSWEILNRIDSTLFPGRKVHRLCFGNPYHDRPMEQTNTYVAQEVLADPESGALMLVCPKISPNELASQIENKHFLGFKPYRIYSVTGDAIECRIMDYLPEQQIEVANHYGLIVMLHLSKRKGIADQDNLGDLERLSKKYPDVKWVLAHCARSYYDIPLMKAADRLKHIDNLWYEISSVCDADVMDVLLSLAGPDRVMYGSDDLPVGVTRGKYISYGYAWTEMNEHNNTFDLSHCEPDMTFVRYESLRALRRACHRHGYHISEIDKMFFRNAFNLVYQTRHSI